ncbi:uncharacterized protein [Primulina huaijiensis]|uniref:uncharacterized protein isoform X1 n=1 Tax=Primulina huaijiensis TaxID=1492673 RepID=UPI003CC74D23
MHIENTTKGRDLSPATDELWKKFYVRQFGIESANLVVERMGQKRVIFKWKQLYEAKLKDREEATQKSLDRIKKRYQEEDAKPEGFPNRFFIPSSIFLQKQHLYLQPCPPGHPRPTTPTPPGKLRSSPLCPEVTSFTSDQYPPSQWLQLPTVGSIY